MIRAGAISEIEKSKAKWVFVDIGFSQHNKTCGVLFDDEHPQNLTFGKAVPKVVDYIVACHSAVNLVIEAPLSVCFSEDGNPKPRSIETSGRLSRYWYVGAGCMVMVAGMYLIKELYKAEPSNRVSLYEAFVSFKSGGKSDHKKEVLRLREAVRDPKKFSKCFVSPDKLANGGRIYSALAIADIDYGIPAVIKLDRKHFSSRL